MDAGTLELVELDMRLDFEHTPRCEAPAEDGKVATWIGTTTCCEIVCYSCTVHHDRDLAIEAEGRGWLCSFCNAEDSIVIWKPIA